VAHHFGPHLGVPTHAFFNAQIGECAPSHSSFYLFPLLIFKVHPQVFSNGIKLTFFCGEIFPFSKKKGGHNNMVKV
jgi:hypothetical protein